MDLELLTNTVLDYWEDIKYKRDSKNESFNYIF